MLKPILGSQLQLGHPLACGLAGCWLLNEGAGGKILDLSGNSYNGSVIAGTWVPGQFGSAIELSGTSEYLQIPNFPEIRGGTYSIWLNTHTTSGAHQFFSQSGQPELRQVYQTGTSLAWFYINGAGTNSSNSFTDVFTAANEWHLYTLVYREDEDVFYVYIDGVFFKTDTNSDGVQAPSGTNTLNIGRYHSSDAEEWDGLIDIPTIWNRPLFAPEIAQHHREQFCMFEKYPIELWSAATLGAPPVGNAAIMTLNTGFWGPTF